MNKIHRMITKLCFVSLERLYHMSNKEKATKPPSDLRVSQVRKVSINVHVKTILKQNVPCK